MSGGKILQELLSSMDPNLHDETYGFLTFKRSGNLQDFSMLHPIMTFQEAEGTTLIAPIKEMDAQGLSYEFPCSMITLNIHSSLEAVGFLAVITTHLAKINVGVNPVSGFFHDHLFVPVDRADEVMKSLRELIRTYKSH